MDLSGLSRQERIVLSVAQMMSDEDRLDRDDLVDLLAFTLSEAQVGRMPLDASMELLRHLDDGDNTGVEVVLTMASFSNYLTLPPAEAANNLRRRVVAENRLSHSEVLEVQKGIVGAGLNSISLGSLVYAKDVSRAKNLLNIASLSSDTDPALSSAADTLSLLHEAGTYAIAGDYQGAAALIYDEGVTDNTGNLIKVCTLINRYRGTIESATEDMERLLGRVESHKFFAALASSVAAACRFSMEVGITAPITTTVSNVREVLSIMPEILLATTNQDYRLVDLFLSSLAKVDNAALMLCSRALVGVPQDTGSSALGLIRESDFATPLFNRLGA